MYLAVSLVKGFGGFSWWLFFVRYPRHLVFADVLSDILGVWFFRLTFLAEIFLADFLDV